MAADIQDARASATVDKPKAKGPTPLYSKNGKPRQRYLRELVAALPAKSGHREKRREIPTGNGAKRRGLGRAEMRAYVRQEQRKEIREFVPKTLPRPIWRNVLYAFRRFNPEGLATEQREAA